MKFGILTGGGDSPGMNAFVRSVVRCSLNLRPATSIWGVVDGWKGLMENNYIKLGKREVAGICHRGGTMLGTLRLPELEFDADLQETLALNLQDNNFDYLFVCGGNGSLKAANVINQIIQHNGYKTRILASPGSIDDDVCNNYGASIGFYSAVDKSLEMMEWIRDTASAHRRVYIVKSMGRDSANLAMYAGVATGAEYVIYPKDNPDFDHIATMIDERERDSRIIVAEGYEKSVGEVRFILEEIFRKRNVTHEVRTVDMSYFQRGGRTSIFDILQASWLGYSMVKDAFDKCDSNFYITHYPTEVPTKLPLDVAANEDQIMRPEIDATFKEFADALK